MAPKAKRKKDDAPESSRAGTSRGRSSRSTQQACSSLLENLNPELLRKIVRAAMGDPQHDPWALPAVRVADTAGLACASRTLRALVVDAWRDELRAEFQQPPPHETQVATPLVARQMRLQMCAYIVLHSDAGRPRLSLLRRTTSSPPPRCRSGCATASRPTGGS
jgi:hypothetical protein